MTANKKVLSKWILVVSGLFALMEIIVSIIMFIAPESMMMENVNMNAKGVHFLMYMWATRQFALGFIFAFATIKRSVPMLTLAYIFLLVMFIGDMFVGFTQSQNSLIYSAVVMCVIAATMLLVLSKRR